MSKAEVVPLTAARYEQFYGEPCQQRLMGYALEIDGTVVGIGGLVLADGFWILFAEVPAEAKAMPKMVMRVARKVMAMARQRKLPVLATRDDSEPTSERFLSHHGFVHVEGEWWRLEAWRP